MKIKLSETRVWTILNRVDIRSLEHLNELTPWGCYMPVKEDDAYSDVTILVAIERGVPADPKLEPILLLPAWSTDNYGYFPVMVGDTMFMTATEIYPHDYYWSPVTREETRGRLMKPIPWHRNTIVILALYPTDKCRPPKGTKLILHHCECNNYQPLDAPEYDFAQSSSSSSST